jgi:hemolysin activation/secretion protein
MQPPPAGATTLEPDSHSNSDRSDRNKSNRDSKSAITTAEYMALTSGIPSAAELEANATVIGNITIVNGDVFDTDLPQENNSLFRLANRLHIETRPQVILSQLLFKAGDVYSARVMRESERILRLNTYLFDAKIVPTAYHDGMVDLEVRTRDVWTLKPGISLSRKGGENEAGFEFEESNLLGLGKEVGLSYSKDVDRSSTKLSYLDPHLLGTWNRLDVAYASNSDGKLRQFELGRPFYSLATPWAAGITVKDWQRVDSRYDLGKVVDKFSHSETNLELAGGWSTGLAHRWITRLSAGAAYENDEFAPAPSDLSAAVLPENRKLVYPFVQLDLLQDAYEERRNQDQIERTEDYYSGTFATLRLGYAAEDFGSDRDAMLLSLNTGTSLELDSNRDHTLMLNAIGSTRIENGDLRNAVLSGDARYYWRLSQRQLFFALLSGTVSKNLDQEQQILLGGDNGLRGYPLRYQDGTSRVLLTLEHRIYTKYYLFRLFNVGGAVFFDAGRTWGTGTAGGVSQGVLKDVGVGLRLGSSRSAFGNVIHVDIAMPLDGDDSIDSVQFLVGTKKSF